MNRVFCFVCSQFELFLFKSSFNYFIRNYQQYLKLDCKKQKQNLSNCINVAGSYLKKIGSNFALLKNGLFLSKKVIFCK